MEKEGSESPSRQNGDLSDQSESPPKLEPMDVSIDTSAVSLGSGPSDTSPSKSESAKKKSKPKKSKGKDANRSWTKIEDPHAPRKPRSAYVHFLSSRRAFYGTAKQGCDQRRINVLLAAEWQALSPEDRHKYHDLSAKERAEYQTALQAYQKTEQYASFMQKKELIMRQRKQCRKMGIESDSFVESMMMNMNTQEPKSKKNTSKQLPDLNFVTPMLPNTDIPIFSKEFLEYNKERENRLRQIRRSIGIAEDEQESMKSTIERLQANCDVMKTQTAEDSKILNDATILLNTWIQIANAALHKGSSSTFPELTKMSPSDATEWLSAIANHSGVNSHLNGAVKTALHNVSFLPK